MNFKKVADNKIEIFFSIDDINSSRVSKSVLLSNDYITENLLSFFLDKAKQDFNFIVDDENLILEAVSCSNGLVFTLTKLTSNSSENNKKNFVYRFDCFDDFFAFYNFAKDMNFVISNEFSLYFYNGFYYLYVLNQHYLDKLYLLLTEFAVVCDNSLELLWLLDEYGKLVLDFNSIDSCLSSFN